MITGASGYIGTFMRRALDGRWAVRAFDRRSGFDVTDAQAVATFVTAERPAAVVHLVNYGGLQRCERDPAAARRVIVQGTHNVASACAEQGCHLIVVSTDYVFDGMRGGYREHDEPRPRSVFGRLKLAAEATVMELHRSNALILRTAGVYGYRGPKPDNFDVWVLDCLAGGRTVVAFDDVYNTPTSIADLVDGIERCAGEALTGLYHLAGPERVSRYEFCRRLARAKGFPEELVVPGSAGNAEGDLRPRDASLVSDALSRAISMEFSGLERGLSQAHYPLALQPAAQQPIRHAHARPTT